MRIVVYFVCMRRKRFSRRRRGFTLVELVLSTGLLTAGVVGALWMTDPLGGMAEMRDMQRRADVERVHAGLMQYRDEHNGAFPVNIGQLDLHQVAMIGTQAARCTDFNEACGVDVTVDRCVDLRELVAGAYLSGVPVAPVGREAWTAGHTGYTVERMANNTVTIRSCETDKKRAIEVGE